MRLRAGSAIVPVRCPAAAFPRSGRAGRYIERAAMRFERFAIPIPVSPPSGGGQTAFRILYKPPGLPVSQYLSAPGIGRPDDKFIGVRGAPPFRIRFPSPIFTAMQLDAFPAIHGHFPQI